MAFEISIFWYSILSVLIVSLISFVGLIGLGFKAKSLRKILIYLISFSAGALLGDVFIHLLPEVVENGGFTLAVSGYILLGVVMFFFLEKVIHWQHCHSGVMEGGHVHSFAYMNLVGDGFHNFLDGVIIAASYLISIPAGIATTIAVLLHEIPQEIGDFAVLLHGGFSKGKALALNFASALLAVLGALVVFFLEGSVDNLEIILVPVAAGGFVYIAGSDLIPELHRHSDSLARSLLQLLAFVVGILVMAGLLLLE
jgi:zinc and cadmium transporter